jgi:hypothetical protein
VLIAAAEVSWRFSTNDRRERNYVCALRADVGPGETPLSRRRAAVGQLGGAMAPNSAHLGSNLRCACHGTPCGGALPVIDCLT